MPDRRRGETPNSRSRCASGSDSQQLIGRRIPVSGSTTGAVFADHIPRSVPQLAFDSPPAGEFGPALALPLGVGSRSPGCCSPSAAARVPRDSTRRTTLVSTFADQAALALQRAETQTARRELEVLADRDRIARDLHDHVIRRLFAVGLAMQRHPPPGQTTQQAARLNDQIDELDRK